MARKKSHDLAPHELFRMIDTQAIPRDYRDKQAIFTQGDKADAMFYIQNGNVKLTVASKGGKKAVIAILRRGGFFGEGCLVRQSMRMSSATSIQPSTIARVKRVAIVRLIHEDPTFARLVISHLLSRIERIEEDFVDQIFSSSEKRLARILLVLSSFGLKSKAEPAVLKVSQQTLAEMVGSTRSRVSYFMNRFRKMGLIHYNGGLLVRRTMLTFLLHD